MSEEFPNYRYLANGRVVALMQSLDRGFLVAPVVTRGDEEESEFIDYCRPFVAEEVFDEEPVEKYGPKIRELEERISILRAEKDAMELAKRNLTTEEAQIKSRCAAIPALRHVFDYIDGKVTHYVMMGYAGPQIVAFEDTKAEYAAVRDGKKLLSLYGDSKGDLQWRLNAYSDGSGSKHVCYPAMSYEEAVKIAARLIEETLSANHYNDGGCIKAADELGIPVEPQYRERHRLAQLASAEDMLARTQASLSEWRQKVEALKP